MERKRPKRGRPQKADKANANIALRIRPDERKAIEACAEMQGFSMNRFMVDATLAVCSMINGTTPVSPQTRKNLPQVIDVGIYLRSRGK